VLSCAELTGAAPSPDAGTFEHRTASPADTGHIVAVLNECHGGEELFRPYTVDSLTTRLERAPDVYSWSSLLLSDQAVVGTWMARRTHLRRQLDGAGSSTETISVRGLVLDYGFRPGAEDEFDALLRITARGALAAGVTDLSVFSSDPSPGSARLRSLAADIEEYELSTPYTPEPQGADERGLYVDQVYF